LEETRRYNLLLSNVKLERVKKISKGLYNDLTIHSFRYSSFVSVKIAMDSKPKMLTGNPFSTKFIIDRVIF